jgi:HEAT repeat protein
MLEGNNALRAIVFLLLISSASGQTAARYAELRRVINRNTGFAHATRGVNMYTLYALRGCVTEQDLPVLERLLSDKDRVTRMAAADVLADLKPAGQDVLRAKLSGTQDASERIMLQDALDYAQRLDYRPILQYPLSAIERAKIRGCR